MIPKIVKHLNAKMTFIIQILAFYLQIYVTKYPINFQDVIVKHFDQSTQALYKV